MYIIFLIFSVSLLCIVIPYFFKTLPLKDIKEEEAPKEGNLVKLSNGNLYYKLHESKHRGVSKKIIVLVHGFSTPSFVWNGMLDFLLDGGYSVLVYDHYGRGYSDRPRIKYNKELYVESLKELLNILGLEEPVNLVGYSMGGPIVGYFADKYPERVKTVSMIAPAGFMQNISLPNNWITKPIIGEWFWHVFGNRIYGIGQMSETSYSDDQFSINQEEFLINFKKQLAFSGFVESLLSTVRNFNLFDTRKMYSNLGKKKIPVFVAWGTKDGVVSYEGSKELLERIPTAKLLTIEGGTHDITYRQPSQVAPALVDFLSDH